MLTTFLVNDNMTLQEVTKKLVKMQIKHVKDERGNTFMTKYEKGYGIQRISKRMIKKAAFGEAIQTVKDVSVLQERMQEAVATDGKIFGLYHKKELMGYYIFTKEILKKDQVEYSFKESIFSLSDNKKDEVAVFRLIESYMFPECESMKEGFEQDIKSELKESMMWYDVKVVIWEEEAFVLEEKKGSGWGGIGGIGMALLFGIVYGQIFDNVALGICFAMMWGVAFGTIFSSVKVKGLKPVEEVLAKERIKEEEDATL